MNPEEHVCLCYKVPLNKVQAFLEREKPSVPSLLSECLGAGTGCGWCVPYLEQLHEQHAQGKDVNLNVTQDAYTNQRKDWKATGNRPDDTGADTNAENS